MESDAEMAKRLQEEFNGEAERMELQNQKDEKLAQMLASRSHNLSGSDTESDLDLQEEHTDKNNESAILENDKITKDEDSDVQSSSVQDCEPVSMDKSNENSEIIKQVSVLNNSKRSVCKYGSKCYRKNSSHLREFYHPESSSDNGESSSQPVQKKLKTEHAPENHLFSQNSSLPFDQRLKLSEPFNLFLNKCYNVPETRKDWLTLVFPDLLNPKLGTLIESCQINFMVDLNYIMEYYKALKQDDKPALFIYGQLEGNSHNFSKVTCKKVNMPFQYGVHHSKMMLFHYQEGCRIVIHTANLIQDDWMEKTQGFWISPLFPPLENGKPSLLDGDSSTRFKHDLVDYLLSYKINELNRWTQILKAHDMSSCNVFFIGSVPGYHVGENKSKYGHIKCRNLLRKYSSWAPRITHPVVVQCSSIGSLGKDNKSWLTSELGVSLSGGSDTTSNSTVKLVYPSLNDVRNSSQGYGGGSCLPYNSNTHSRQPWLIKHLHLWRSTSRKRSNAMPHIKTFTRLSADLKTAEYFLLTSSNLSKAAWGQLQKQGSQLFIRSYEAGVLFLPKLVANRDSFPIISADNNSSCCRLSLPYDLPLTPYTPKDQPWFMDTKKTEQDIFGKTYPE